MHVYGMGLCALLLRTDASELHTFEPRQELREWHPKVCIGDTPWPELSWRGLHDTVLGLQLQFEHVLYVQAGFQCRLPLDRILLCLMQRAGFLLCHDYRAPETAQPAQPAQPPPDLDTVQLLVDTDAQGWSAPRPEAVRQLLLAMHTLLSAFCLLVHSTYVPAATAPTNVEDFHRESSMDDFYELHMLATVPIASIVQYRDRFKHLFHSVSQVVYYHFPAYMRTKQLAIEELQADAVPAVNLLPLLQQIHPTVPVLYEHTAAGLRTAHERHAFAWVVLGPFVVLVDRHMHSYAASDLRSLLRLLETGP